MNKLIVIYSASRVGKTTAMQSLIQLDAHAHYEIHDFDERGAPDNADQAWRIRETEYWLTYSHLYAQPIIICGCIVPSEIKNISSYPRNISYILLDASPEIHRARLQQRFPQTSQLGAPKGSSYIKK